MIAEDSFEFLMRSCTLGMMLLVGGGCKLLAYRLSFPWRAIAAITPTIAIAVAFGMFTQDNRSALDLAAIALGTIGITEVLGWSLIRPTLLQMTSVISSTTVTAGIVAAMGFLTIVGSIVYDDIMKERQADHDMKQMEGGFLSPPLQIASRSDVQTDAGTSVELRSPTEEALKMDIDDSEKQYLSKSQYKEQLIRRGPADVICNCHGWVYAAGQYWVEGRWVPSILAENGYTKVDQPKPGDLVVYYDGESQIAHSGIVRYTSDNQPTMIESKWGSIGIFLHNVKDCPYGISYTFYRSTRESHVLRGILQQSSTDANKLAP